LYHKPHHVFKAPFAWTVSAHVRLAVFVWTVVASQHV
jgi:hypothetical protein